MADRRGMWWRRDVAWLAVFVESGRARVVHVCLKKWIDDGLRSPALDGGSNVIGSHSDPTMERAIKGPDMEGRWFGEMVGAMKDIERGIVTLRRLDREVPASDDTCVVCGRVGAPGMQAGRCGACRARVRRAR